MSAIDTRAATSSPLTSAEGQTYLIGEEVYLRPPAPGDAALSQSWQLTPFPVSPDRIRTAIDDGKTGDRWGKGKMHLLIVRQDTDRPVGSLLIYIDWFPHFFVETAMDPIYGDAADRWKGEAVAMAMRLVVDEWQKPIAEYFFPADETATIARLESIGARQNMRFREMYARSGARVDGLCYEYLNPRWVERLGDPALREQPRSGTGEPRPVIAPVVPDDDPPANAIRIGPRVYLRPIQRDDARAVVHWVMRETDANWSNGRGPIGATAFWHMVEEGQKERMPGQVHFAVCLRATDELIGFVGVVELDLHHRYAETASEMINPTFRGGGYGSEAKHLLFDYLFNTLGLHMLISWVLFENTRSAAALRKQGYREAGRMHWTHSRDGTWTHGGQFDLLASEWRAMPRLPESEIAT